MKDTVIIGVVCLVAVAAGVWLFLAGNQNPLSPASPLGPVSYTTLIAGQHSGSITTRTNYRIKSAEELLELWQMVYGTDGPTLPPIDFAKNEVLAIFDGTHSSGGYDVEIASIEDRELSRQISIVRITPGEDCVSTTAITSPYILVTVPKSALPLTREETISVVSCE